MAKISKKLTGLVLGTAFAAMAGLAANDAGAQALQATQCVSLADFNAVLISEGQRTLVVGERIWVENDPTSPTGVKTGRKVNGVSANEDGSIGYQFEGDMPRGTPSNRVCIRAVLENVDLYDAKKTNIPARAYLGGRFNDVVDNSAADGDRPMVIADTVFGVGENKRNGLPIVVFGDLTEKTGSVDTMLADGTPTSVVILHNIDYTTAATERLKERQVATLLTSNPK